MRPGWNPSRRNRHVGTKAHGHGSNNKLVIPESWHGEFRCFYERLSSYVLLNKSIGNREIPFFVEPTRPDWFYPCTIDDICSLLSLCPPEDLSSFDFIVLRQPTRKQRILRPAWGRAIFVYEIASYRGTAIVLEAQNLLPVLWGKSISQERSRELERLSADGHDIRKSKRGIEVHVSLNSLRNTVLFRTLLHEIGHHIDYKRCAENEWDSLTHSEKEDFAHRYAREKYQTLQAQGLVPFPPKFDIQSLQENGLNPEWFCSPNKGG